jgi:glycine oxidase
MTGEARIVKVWDVIVVGAGIIGLSLARDLRKTGRTVLVVERSEPGREASHAAGGMLVNSGDEGSEALRPLADASAQMYPEFVFELQDESGFHIDWRSNGTICFPAAGQSPTSGPSAKYLTPAQINELEPALSPVSRSAVFLSESCVDPRDLVRACQEAAKHRGVNFSSGDPVTSINISDSHVTGVTTTKTSFSSEVVVNCAGAWAGEFAPLVLPHTPGKGSDAVCSHADEEPP